MIIQTFILQGDAKNQPAAHTSQSDLIIIEIDRSMYYGGRIGRDGI